MDLPENSVAFELITSLAKSDNLWAIPWPCLYEFLSVITNRAVWKDNVATIEQAWKQIENWFDSPSNQPIGETENFLKILGDFVKRPHVRGAVVYDARIAAICVANGVEELLTRDRDFSLFPELKTRNPF